MPIPITTVFGTVVPNTICIYIHTHTHIYIYIYIYIPAYIFIYMHIMNYVHLLVKTILSPDLIKLTT